MVFFCTGKHQLKRGKSDLQSVQLVAYGQNFGKISLPDVKKAQGKALKLHKAKTIGKQLQ
jgi:hypothetical protein